MKGYIVKNVYMGYIPEEGRYMLFATETEYTEYMEDMETAAHMTDNELWEELIKRGKLERRKLTT